ncbi:LVIVD repeat-containing protein [Humitalea sp. 24SJ18S-53]|uniref:LVIVD repeat-containing protein n=1 Tax=Humitalea sp. 24SJ18S-53 TaxID=3422307 RepID=UPI003D66CD31
MHEQESKNFRLLGHDPSAGFGGGSLVEVRRGHAYVGSTGWDGHEGFTVHDVTDPRAPRKVWQFIAPPGIRMHKLRLVGDGLLYVNSERLPGSTARAGLYVFDISRPAEPREVAFIDMPGSGPHRFGIDNARGLAFLPNDAEGWKKRVIWTLDIRNPLKPEVISIWGLPWQRAEGAALGNDPMPAETECTLHGPPMIRGDRMFAAFWGGGVAVIDCANLSDMKLAGHICWSPPFVGSTHTAWPIGDRPYLVVTDEARGKQNYWDSQFMWILDIRDEKNPVPVSTWFPERERYFNRGGRFGAHNILENIPGDGPWANTVFITYFNAGLRAVDVSDVLRPKEVGCFVPAQAEGARTIQSNDIGADEHGRLYLIDRWGAGMHIVEYTG